MKQSTMKPMKPKREKEAVPKRQPKEKKEKKRRNSKERSSDRSSRKRSKKLRNPDDYKDTFETAL